MELSKFSELENRIRNVVQEQIRLKRRNEELEGLLKQKELELNEANISVGELREEKDSIRKKVDLLLDLLQDINAQS